MEPDASIQPIVAARVLQYDAAAEVPEDYDPLCKACGHSLLGSADNRCPGCQQPFEGDQLPFARVPWLHRRKIGRFLAYTRTVRMVLTEPREFAAELCRPVRISIADARLFRRMSIWVATAGLGLVLLVFYAVLSLDISRAFRMRRSFSLLQLLDLAPIVIAPMTVLLAFHFFFTAITDLPVFIWKGHPSLKPSELSPIQCYAAAPLLLVLLAPVFVLVMLGLIPLGILRFVPNRFFLLLIWFGLPAAVLLIFTLRTTVRLMIGAGVQRRRAWIMAVYLPLHWIMMAIVCGGCATVAILGEIWVFERLAGRHW